jgi:hypothetical protein
MNRRVIISNSFISRFTKILKDPQNSYKSWEFCYLYFGKKPFNSYQASLLLYQYLTGFGMLRASSPLFIKNFLFLKPVTKFLIKHRDLRGMPINKISTYIEDILRVKKDLKTLLSSTFIPTDTLVTKIMMGSLGCIPAFDTNFIKGIKKLGISKNIQRIAELFGKDNIQEVRKRLALPDFYSDMRIIDMYFWHLGQT